MLNREMQRTLRRLAAAEGFLELGMPKHALTEIEAVEDAGKFESSLQYLKGEALKAQKRYSDAVEPLHRAAETLPIQFSRQAWLSLSECFRESGHTELAAVAAMTADAVQELVERLESEAGLDTVLPEVPFDITATRR